MCCVHYAQTDPESLDSKHNNNNNNNYENCNYDSGLLDSRRSATVLFHFYCWCLLLLVLLS